MKRIIAALAGLAAFILPGAVLAQCSGIFAAGSFCGNSAAIGGLAGTATPTAMFDRAFGGTNNSTIVRLSGVWTVLSSANNGVWITSAAGVPSISSTLPNAVQDNITRLGTIANITTPLGATFGGTGQSSYAVGDLLYAPTTTTVGKLADVATGNVLRSGGVGVAPVWGKAALTTDVVGALPVANGGTNCASASGTCLDNITAFSSTGIMSRTGAGTYTFSTESALIDAIGSTRGSVLYRGAAGWAALTPGTSGFALTSGGAGADPSYSAVGTGTVTNIVCGNTTVTTTGTCAYPYMSVNRSAAAGAISSGTPTKIQFDTKVSDSNSWYDNATNFRYTPLLAGRYRVTVQAECDGATTVTGCYVYIYKNGSPLFYNPGANVLGSGSVFGTGTISAIVTMNGSTDFLEGWGRINGTGALSFGGGVSPVVTFFDAQFISP